MMLRLVSLTLTILLWVVFARAEGGGGSGSGDHGYTGLAGQWRSSEPDPLVSMSIDAREGLQRFDLKAWYGLPVLGSRFESVPRFESPIRTRGEFFAELEILCPSPQGMVRDWIGATIHFSVGNDSMSTIIEMGEFHPCQDVNSAFLSGEDKLRNGHFIPSILASTVTKSGPVSQ